MAQAKRQPRPSDSSFDTRDLPSMGDPEFVDTQCRAMLDEARRIMFERDSPQRHVEPLVAKWSKEFSPKNTAYIQVMSPASLDVFLRARGLGTNDDPADTDAPVRALVATTLERFAVAAMAYHDGKETGEQLGFAIDTAVEDFVALIRGLDNPAD